MHLFVESNFVIELVKRQEQSDACQALLLAAEERKIELHLPAFCLMEPVYTMGTLSKERRAMQRQINNELIQASREQTAEQTMRQLQRDLATALTERDVLQQERLMETSIRLATSANLVPLTQAIWLQAAELLQTSSLSLTDALVGASIMDRLQNLEQAPTSLFATRDRRAFKLEDIEERMRERGCEVVCNFDHVAQRLRL